MTGRGSGEETDVLVVGAGPTGLTLAIELERRGVDCTVVEREASSVEGSRAISIQPRTLQLFGDLGVLDEVLDEGTRVAGMSAHRDGTELFRLDADEVDTPYPYLWHLPQNRTERLLLDRLRELGGDVAFERELVGFGQDRETVTATIRRTADPDESADGSDARADEPAAPTGRADGGDRTERITARWLVGCDGASSRVRRTLGVAFEGVTQAEQFLVADAGMEWDRPDDEAALWFHGDGLFVTFPMPGDRWRLFADVSDYPDGARPEAAAESFERLLDERTEHPGTAVRRTEWTSEFTVDQRMASDYRSGRAFLAGDAAHVHVPLGGVGMNTGIQDAYNLGWKLAAVVDGDAPDALLDTYGDERAPIAEDVLASTGPSISFLTSESLPVRVLRDRIGAAVLDTGAVQRRILRADTQLDLTYRDGPLAGAHSDAPAADLSAGAGAGVRAAGRTWDAPNAGDRAPDAACRRRDGTATGLHRELRGPEFTLLAFVGADPSAAEPAALAARVRRLAETTGDAVDYRLVVPDTEGPEDTVTADPLPTDARTLFDPDGECHRRYGATRPTFYLVRPDDYVGFRARPARVGPVLDYLAETVGAPGATSGTSPAGT